MGETEFDTVLDLCQDKHRRIILAVLDAHKRTLTVQDLTKSIVKHNHNIPLTEVSAEAVTQINYRLHHLHLPKLEASGVIEYDSESQRVKPTKEFDQLQHPFSAIIDADPDLATSIKL